MSPTPAINKIGRSRWLPVVLMVLIGVAISFTIVQPLQAGVTDEQIAAKAENTMPAAEAGSTIGGKIAEIFSHFLFSLVSLFGRLLTVLIAIMVQIAQFNNFTKATAVQQGWVVARDLCNLLLVVVLLLIAWGTVLRVESYHYRRMLPKFILMAILINFSKSICGFLIDISQVIMLSFVNAFKDYAYYNLTSGVGLENILKFGDSITGSSFLDTAGALLLGLILIALMMGAVLLLVFILLGRIIVLWILVVLSPVAYLGETIGILKKAATTWWKMFGDYLVVGPLVAFFLWLAMLVISANPGNVGQQIAPQGTGSQTVVNSSTSQTQAGLFTAAVSRISSSDNLLSFIVAVGLLFAASMAAQQIKTLGGDMGQKAYGKATNAASFIARSPVMAAGKGNRWLGGKTGIDLNPVRNWGRLKAGFAAGKKREEANMALTAEKRAGRGGLLGLLATAAPSWESQYVGAGLGTTYQRTVRGSALLGGKAVMRGRDAKFEANKKKEIDQRQMEIKEMEEQQKVIAGQPDPLNHGKTLQAEIDRKKKQIKDIQETSRLRSAREMKYQPSDRSYQRLLQSRVAEEGKVLPTTAEELVEQRNAAVASGKGGMVTAMAANEKLMQLGRGDLVKGDHKDIVAAIEAMGQKLGMSKDDALYHAGNVAAIGASKGKAEYMNLITFKNGRPMRQDDDKHLRTYLDAKRSNPGADYAKGETGGLTQSERSDPSNPDSPKIQVLNEAGIAHLLNGAITPLVKSISNGKLSPKYDFLGLKKNIQILEQIKKLLTDSNRLDEAKEMGTVIEHARKIEPSLTPGVSRTDQSISSAKNIKSNIS